MRAVLQRVSRASVTVDGEVVGELTRPGLLALVGVTHDDGPEQVATMARKIADLRILHDERSVLDEGAPVLVVSQFTLYADTRKGRRPSWNAAAPGPVAEPVVEQVVAALRERGRRGADRPVRRPHARRARQRRPGDDPARRLTPTLYTMSSLAQLQSWIVLGLSVVALGVEVYALVDCVRRRSDAFVAAGKRTKPFWLLVTGVAALLGVVAVGGFPGLLAIIAIVAAGVYLADVKPALDQVMGRGSGNQGPYGPW